MRTGSRGAVDERASDAWETMIGAGDEVGETVARK